MTAKASAARGANLQVVKSANLSLIFGLIHQKEPISRAKLAKLSGLSPTTVSALVDELIEEGMVEETGLAETSITGRKPVLLAIRPSGGYVIGIELAAEGYSAGLYDLKGALRRERTGALSGTDALLSALDDMLGREIGVEKLLGVCIGIPAIIDKAEMRVISSTLVDPEQCNEVFRAVRARFPTVRVQMGNESCFCAYSEKAALSQAVRSLVYIDINVGIGAGIILDNRIFTGAFGNAGELGHVSIDEHGPLCRCGNHGCLETLASVPALAARLNAALDAETAQRFYPDGVTLSAMAQALSRHEAKTTAAVRETCRLLAVGINNVVNILNPEAIVLGGAMCRLGKPFLSFITEELHQIGFAPNMKKISITTSQVAGNAVTHGASRFLLDGIFHSAGFWVE